MLQRLSILFTAVFFTIITNHCLADDEKNNPQVEITTNQGSFIIELFPEQAPISVKNFLEYVDDGFFEETIFHRVIPGFMVQGGGFTTDMAQKTPKSPIKNEANNGLHNSRGTLAMARTRDINSATSQFFINVESNSFLNHGSRDFGYAVFGRVIKGMDIIDNISLLPTSQQRGHQNVPVEPIIMLNIKVID